MFGPKRKLKPITDFQIDHHLIKSQSSIKYLGIDIQMQIKRTINTINKKVNSGLRFMKRKANGLSAETRIEQL